MFSRISFEQLYNSQCSFFLKEKYFNQQSNPDSYGGLHWHDYSEIEIIISGECINIQNGKEYHLKRRDAILCSPLDFHIVKPIKDFKVINISFRNSILDKTLSYLTTHSESIIPKTLSENDFIYIMNLCNMVSDAQKVRSEENELLAKYAISAILVLLIKNSNTNISYVPKKIQSIIKYIDEHFTDNISLEVIANRFSMSASYLGKLVKSSTNLSYNAYINKLRINYACNLILNTSMSFPDIAKESGYSTTTYFYSSFKKILGMTPGEYKDSHKNGNPYKYDF